MADTTDINFSHLPEQEVTWYQKLMEKFAKEENPGVSRLLMRSINDHLNEFGANVRMMEAFKTGQFQSEPDPKYKIRFKRKDTFSQLLMKLCRVTFRLYDLEYYYGILNEPFEFYIRIPFERGPGQGIFVDLNKLKGRVFRLYSYLVPEEMSFDQVHLAEIPDKLPHVKGPLNLEEARRRKREAHDKYEKECKERAREFRALPREEAKARREADHRKLLDCLGLVKEEDGTIRVKKKTGKVQKRRTKGRTKGRTTRGKAKKAI